MLVNHSCLKSQNRVVTLIAVMNDKFSFLSFFPSFFFFFFLSLLLIFPPPFACLLPPNHLQYPSSHHKKFVSIMPPSLLKMMLFCSDRKSQSLTKKALPNKDCQSQNNRLLFQSNKLQLQFWGTKYCTFGLSIHLSTVFFLPHSKLSLTIVPVLLELNKWFSIFFLFFSCTELLCHSLYFTKFS